MVASPDNTGEKRAGEHGVNRRGGVRVTGVDACRGGWVAVSLEVPPETGPAITVTAGVSLAALLAPGTTVVGIDMPLGLLATGWRAADRAARGLLGPRRSSVFAIPPRAVWAETSYRAANERCRELTGQGFSIQAWGLRAKLLEANSIRY
jgi:predicted RNase H-like nuclease